MFMLHLILTQGTKNGMCGTLDCIQYMNTGINATDEIFSRGTAEFIDPDGAFRAKLAKKAKGEYPQDIIVKFGIDPTRPDIHLGHAVALRKLRALQDAGCKVVFLVGDFTARIGDPTGKSKVRPQVEQAEVEKNMKTYLDQVGKILLTDPVHFSWIRNSDWYYGVTDIEPNDSILTLSGVLPVRSRSFLGKAVLYEKTRMQVKDLHKSGILGVSLATLFWALGRITYARLIERDMFQERLKKGEELYMHEMLYPVLQGIDSFAIGRIYETCDLEMGGTDQTFNMLMGRDVMKMNAQPEQAVLAVNILAGTDGKEKMSKSLDNYISITDAPSDMYGKVMSVPDTVIPQYFELCTYTPLAEVEEIKKSLAGGTAHPRDVKMRLARQIVAIYHGEEKADFAERDFIGAFQKGGIPENVEKITMNDGEMLADILARAGVVASKNEYRRLVQSGAIKDAVSGEKITDELLVPSRGQVFKVGKHRFAQID